jgi:hypothetical protein
MTFDQKAYMKDYRKSYMPAYRESNPEAFKQYDKDRHLRAKLGAFEKLGGPVCRDCGETELEFLTLGHLNGDGAKDRSETGRRQIYLEIARGLRPPEDYAVQCRNCNSGGNLDLRRPLPLKSKYECSGEPCKKCGSPKLVRSSAHPKYGRRKRTECRNCGNGTNRLALRALRASVITSFGGKCACCGELSSSFLTIDHLHDDGNSSRKQESFGSAGFYRGLLDGTMDRSRFQILCWNCNFSKHLGGGICIHTRK